MKILVIHQQFLAARDPGGSRFNEMARLWSEQGHDVIVVAGARNYATGSVAERYRRRWIVKELCGGVTVWRCYVPASYNRGYVGRMWAFFGFTLSAITAVIAAERPDIVIATSPPLVTVIPGWIAARWRRSPIPWIFEIRDLWPESAITTGVLAPGSVLTKLLYRLEAWACATADRINVLTPAFRDDLLARGLAPENKIVVVPNGADADAFRPGPRENDIRQRFGWGDAFVVLYAGAHGRANAVGQLIDAAALLADRSDILIATVGDGPERPGLEADARRRGLRNIVFLGPQSKDAMPGFIAAADCGAAVLQANATFAKVYPNKVFDYMACERPTLLTIDGVARKLVCDDARAGLFAPPENGAAIADVIRRLADDPAGCREMGANGRAWVLANATRRLLAKRYLDIMDSLVTARGQDELGLRRN